MRMRPLGQSGIRASVVGFGAWALGGWMWGGSDEAESIKAIHAFLDAGGNLIDTAPVYGFGLSEEIVGKAIADRRDKVVLATKCVMRWDLNEQQKKHAVKKFSTTQKVIDFNGDRGEQTFDVYVYAGRDGLRQEIERSLKRLRTDVIDLYQTHWQMDNTPIEERMGALEELRKEGKIRAIGISNATPDDLSAYQAYGTVDSDQELYSMLDRDKEQTMLPRCAEDGVAFLAYSPLGQGLLTGKITPDRVYGEDDHRYYKPRFKPENIRKVQKMLAPMRPIAERHGATPAQVTMAWTLAQRGCSHVLCGARTAKQAIENAGAGSVELSEDELAMISEAVNGYDGV